MLAHALTIRGYESSDWLDDKHRNSLDEAMAYFEDNIENFTFKEKYTQEKLESVSCIHKNFPSFIVVDYFLIKN
jgi:hypothetical protein